MVVTRLPSLGQGETGSVFSNFKHKLHHEKKRNLTVFFAITIGRIRTFYTVIQKNKGVRGFFVKP